MKGMNTDEWNRMEVRNRPRHVCMVDWFSTKLQRQLNGGVVVFQKWCWSDWISVCNKNNELPSISCNIYKINSKRIIDWSVKPKNMKLLEYRKKIFCHLGFEKNVLVMTPETIHEKRKIMLYFIKFKNIWFLKDTLRKRKS